MAAPFYYLKSSDGKPSLSATLVLVSFWTTTALYILSAFDAIGPIKLKAFDAGAVGAYMIPMLGNYCFRRHTEAKVDIAAIANGQPLPKPPKNEQGGD